VKPEPAPRLVPTWVWVVLMGVMAVSLAFSAAGELLRAWQERPEAGAWDRDG
jgi:hypothetical protein